MISLIQLTKKVKNNDRNSRLIFLNLLELELNIILQYLTKTVDHASKVDKNDRIGLRKNGR